MVFISLVTQIFLKRENSKLFNFLRAQTNKNGHPVNHLGEKIRNKLVAARLNVANILSKFTYELNLLQIEAIEKWFHEVSTKLPTIKCWKKENG